VNESTGTFAARFEAIHSLAGRTALVTGASRGIGAAIARMLAWRGAAVAVNHYDDADAAQALVHELRACGTRAEAFDVDIARPDIPDALVAAAERVLGVIDVLVVCAAGTIYAKLEAAAEADIDRIVEMNFKSTIRLFNAVVPGMAKRGFGRVVTIGSINQEAPIPILPVYGALKSAQYNLVRGEARRWSAHGVTFNNVAPGLIRTDRNDWRRRPGGDWAQLSKQCSYLHRAGEPEEVAFVVAMLCSPGASYITGENVHVSGGAQIPGPRDIGEPL
jgi:NAD(P)-dependent dehydrogenase (short-subunit alcohol dehydrogenase family)